MPQYLEAKIPVPDECVIISKIEYEELKKADDTGRWMNLTEVLDRINRKYDWFISKVLKNPKYRNSIDIEKNKMGLFTTLRKGETHIYF